jgi:hypothetical protein
LQASRNEESEGMSPENAIPTPCPEKCRMA